MNLQHWGEMYGIDQAYDETNTQFKARLLIKMGVAPRTTGTQDHLEQIRVNMMRDLPVGPRLGPLMVLGVSKRFGGIFTRVAFWLLKRAGWQMTEGGQ